MPVSRSGDRRWSRLGAATDGLIGQAKGSFGANRLTTVVVAVRTTPPGGPRSTAFLFVGGLVFESREGQAVRRSMNKLGFMVQL